MTSAKITRVETVKQGVNATLFNPFADPITLRLTVVVSADPSEPQPIVMNMSFQLIAFEDNRIKFQTTKRMEISPGGSAEYYAWVDVGTAENLNLSWLRGFNLFGFRGAAELITPARGESGEKAIDAFDVSEIHWFRLETLAKL